MSASDSENPGRSPRERAEEMVDQAGERIGELAVTLGHRLRVFMARAREEAEDIMAEAQSMRGGAP